MNSSQILGFVYCGVSFICAFILLYCAKTIKEITSKYTDARYIFYSYLFAGFAAIFDCVYALREMVGISFHVFFSYTFTIAYTLSSILTGSYWIIYAEKKQNSWFSRNKTRFTFFKVPLYVMIVLTITTPITHLYFYFDGNTYNRGPLFMILSSVLFAYVIQNGVTALIRSFKIDNYVERHELRRLFTYAFSYLIIQGIQLVLPIVFPYRPAGTMIIFVIFLIQNMKERIGLDALTCINNRYEVDRYLGTLVNSENNFEIVMMDIDNFKMINDKFGHNTGDKALQYVAEALKETVPNKCFFARFGGDEFIIINKDISHSISGIENKINEKLDEILNRNSCKYSITVSAGYALKYNSNQNISYLIESADEKLYLQKKHKKSNNKI